MSPELGSVQQRRADPAARVEDVLDLGLQVDAWHPEDGNSWKRRHGQDKWSGSGARFWMFLTVSQVQDSRRQCAEIWVSQGVGCRDPLLWDQHQHLLDQVFSFEGQLVQPETAAGVMMSP